MQLVADAEPVQKLAKESAEQAPCKPFDHAQINILRGGFSGHGLGEVRPDLGQDLAGFLVARLQRVQGPPVLIRDR